RPFGQSFHIVTQEEVNTAARGLRLLAACSQIADGNERIPWGAQQLAQRRAAVLIWILDFLDEILGVFFDIQALKALLGVSPQHQHNVVLLERKNLNNRNSVLDETPGNCLRTAGKNDLRVSALAEDFKNFIQDLPSVRCPVEFI